MLKMSRRVLNEEKPGELRRLEEVEKAARPEGLIHLRLNHQRKYTGNNITDLLFCLFSFLMSFY